jgi:hypothetical protein
MYTPALELGSFDGTPIDLRCTGLRALLEALVAINRLWLDMHPDTPLLYHLAPKYEFKTRPLGLDRWQDIPRTLELRSGDCKDFACWRVAELRKQGVSDVSPYISVGNVTTPQGPLLVYHIQVRVGSPTMGDHIEDPSAILGMPAQATAEQLQGNGEVVSGPAKYQMIGNPAGYQRYQLVGGNPAGYARYQLVGEGSPYGHEFDSRTCPPLTHCLDPNVMPQHAGAPVGFWQPTFVNGAPAWRNRRTGEVAPRNTGPGYVSGPYQYSPGNPHGWGYAPGTHTNG